MEFNGASTITASVRDNWFISHPIPRSEQQYQWVTSSLSSGSIVYGYTELSGGFFVQALPTISRSVAYEDGDFDYLTLRIIDPVTSSTNTLGLPLDVSNYAQAYDNSEYGGIPVFTHGSDYFNTLMLNRNGPYQYPMWKQVRLRNHPVVRAHNEDNVYSVVTKNTYDITVGALRGNSIKQFTEPVVYSEQVPLRHNVNAGDVRLTFKNSFGNKLIHFAS